MLAAAAIPPIGAQEATEGGPALLMQSRELVAEFGTRLRAALTKAMQVGGPVAAIGVCKDLAPQIAAELPRRSGAKISCTWIPAGAGT